MTEFADRFGRPPEVRAWAPGRVNLVGEHTDYNDGYVLPLALTLRTTVEAARRDDRRVVVHSAGVDPPVGSYERGAEAPSGGWLDYVMGATWVLAALGHDPGGADLRITSEVPVGSGLSSSAALLVATLRALRALFGLPLDDLALALAARRAEVELVGVPVGILDPFACSFAEPDVALFLDTRTLQTERVALPAGVGVWVIDTGIRHDHGSGEYRVRRQECELAARQLGVDALRDLGVGDLHRVQGLEAPLDRRARHVITENQRVLDMVDALRAGDPDHAGALLAGSHWSLSEDFQSSLPEIDALVHAVSAVPGVHGARLTGGGFGGCLVALVDGSADLERALVEAASGVPGIRPEILAR